MPAYKKLFPRLPEEQFFQIMFFRALPDNRLKFIFQVFYHIVSRKGADIYVVILRDNAKGHAGLKAGDRFQLLCILIVNAKQGKIGEPGSLAADDFVFLCLPLRPERVECGLFFNAFRCIF